MFRTLMTTRRFAPLFWCQFFSAFNDNFLRNALVFLILFKVGGAGGGSSPMLVTLAGAVFIGPFFILSGLGGQLTIVAVMLHMYELTGSTFAVSMIAVAGLVPMVIAGAEHTLEPGGEVTVALER